MAQRLAESTGDRKWFTIATTVEQRMREAKGIIANVDYYAAPVLYYLGFPWRCSPILSPARASAGGRRIFSSSMPITASSALAPCILVIAGVSCRRAIARPCTASYDLAPIPSFPLPLGEG